MSELAVQVNGLSKEYVLGGTEKGYRTFRDAITDAVSAPVRRFRHLRGSAGDGERFWALRDVSFEVKQGEVIGIIGRNGAGKSTLLKVLSRITDPTKGRIHLWGRAASLLEVGTGFHPELTGRENVFLNGAIMGMRRNEIARKFDEIVSFAEVEKFIDTPVKRYSSGMYLRLAFAVAAYLEPEILIVDEVLAVGDQDFQRRCMGRMQAVSRSGRTVLFVSHNMAAISSLCSRAVLLHQGRMEAEGPAPEVVTSYLKSGLATLSADYNLEGCARKGSGTSRATRLRILNGVGEATSLIPLGESVQFEITFQTGEGLRIPNFAVIVTTLDGQRIMRVQSQEMSSPLPPSSQGGRVVCRINELMLAPGPYILTVAIGNGVTESVDKVEQCAQFEVIPTDIYGTGKLPSQAYTGIVARGQWKADYT